MGFYIFRFDNFIPKIVAKMGRLSFMYSLHKQRRSHCGENNNVNVVEYQFEHWFFVFVLEHAIALCVMARYDTRHRNAYHTIKRSLAEEVHTEVCDARYNTDK